MQKKDVITEGNILPRILTARACGVNITPEVPHMHTLGLPKLGRKKTRGRSAVVSSSTEYGRVLRRAFENNGGGKKCYFGVLATGYLGVWL